MGGRVLDLGGEGAQSSHPLVVDSALLLAGTIIISGSVSTAQPIAVDAAGAIPSK